MAGRDPRFVQSADPNLVADAVSDLDLVGQVGDYLGFTDTILPVYLIAQRQAFQLNVASPAFRSTDVFTAGVITGAAGNTIHADTGQLPAGIYDVQVKIQMTSGLVGPVTIATQHRDAANAATLADLGVNLVGTAMDFPRHIDFNFGYELGVDERIRILNLTAIGAGNLSYAVIFARIRG